MEEIRLQKYIAEAGICSRRKAEELILQGKIKVNGKTIQELGTKINPEKDKIEYNGKLITVSQKKVYILLNKPIGYVTTANDQFGRDSVLDLIKTDQRIVPVGRLDMYTSGALILTNDGDFVYQVTHPKHEIEKTYTVTLKGLVTKEEIEQLKKGVKIEDYTTKPAKVKILKIDNEKQQSRLEITIHEGKNRQIRKMCEAINHKVLALHRSKIAGIGVKDLKIRNMEKLNPKRNTKNKRLIFLEAFSACPRYAQMYPKWKLPIAIKLLICYNINNTEEKELYKLMNTLKFKPEGWNNEITPLDKENLNHFSPILKPLVVLPF